MCFCFCCRLLLAAEFQHRCAEGCVRVITCIVVFSFFGGGGCVCASSGWPAAYGGNRCVTSTCLRSWTSSWPRNQRCVLISCCYLCLRLGEFFLCEGWVCNCVQPAGRQLGQVQGPPADLVLCAFLVKIVAKILKLCLQLCWVLLGQFSAELGYKICAGCLQGVLGLVVCGGVVSLQPPPEQCP